MKEKSGTTGTVFQVCSSHEDIHKAVAKRKEQKNGALFSEGLYGKTHRRSFKAFLQEKRMKRYSFARLSLLIAASLLGALICLAGLAELISTSTMPGDTILAVPYISEFNWQFQGQENAKQLSVADNGPVSIAMIVRYTTKTGPEISTRTLIEQINARIHYQGHTSISQLEQVLPSYKLSYWELPQSGPSQPATQIQKIKQTVIARSPVMVLLHESDLGRGQVYGQGDGWVVVTGFSNDGQTVYLNDPDNQLPSSQGWIHGGPMTLPIALFSKALADATLGPRGIVVELHGKGQVIHTTRPLT